MDKIFCIAEAVEDHLRKAVFWNPDKVVTIRKGHHPNWYEAIPAIDLKKEFALPENAFVACCVANTRPMKGIPYLVEAMNLIPSDLPIYLLLVGKGLDTPEVKEIVAKGPAKERVIFTGFRSDALSIDKSADCFVLASLYGEAITKAVIEAMSLGTAPLITDIPGNKNLVLNEKCGLVVPKANAQALANGLMRYYNEPEFREEMAKAAKAYMQSEFHTDKTAEGYYREYNKLLESK
ncbi:MAG: glycosyltransferase family 4 protein [Luteibaculum sp.]